MKWRYTKHPIVRQYGDFKGHDFTGRIITPEQEKSLGGMWCDTPTELLTDKEPEDEREFLVKKAEEKGIEVDKRWGVKKLKEVLDGNGS